MNDHAFSDFDMTDALGYAFPNRDGTFLLLRRFTQTFPGALCVPMPVSLARYITVPFINNDWPVVVSADHPCHAELQLAWSHWLAFLDHCPDLAAVFTSSSSP
jgi:hypothetical protein